MLKSASSFTRPFSADAPSSANVNAHLQQTAGQKILNQVGCLNQQGADQHPTANEDDAPEDTDKQVNNEDDEESNPEHTSVPTSATLQVPSDRPNGLTHDEMACVGWKIKRIFDMGRVDFIRQVLQLTAQQMKYCDEALSPENMLIIASNHT